MRQIELREYDGCEENLSDQAVEFVGDHGFDQDVLVWNDPVIAIEDGKIVGVGNVDDLGMIEIVTSDMHVAMLLCWYHKDWRVSDCSCSDAEIEKHVRWMIEHPFGTMQVLAKHVTVPISEEEIKML